jgi:hypothetical protein
MTGVETPIQLRSLVLSGGVVWELRRLNSDADMPGHARTTFGLSHPATPRAIDASNPIVRDGMTISRFYGTADRLQDSVGEMSAVGR